MRRPACLFSAMVVLFLSSALLAPSLCGGQSPVVIRLPPSHLQAAMDNKVLKAQPTKPSKKPATPSSSRSIRAGSWAMNANMVRKMHGDQAAC